MIDNLIEIQYELLQHHRNRNVVLSECIQERLSNSLRNYYKEIYSSYMYLRQKNEIDIMKGLADD